MPKLSSTCLFVCLCFTSLQQRGHLESAPPFTVPCEGREARFLHGSHRESNPGPSRGSPLRYRCATQAPLIRNEIKFEFKESSKIRYWSFTLSFTLHVSYVYFVKSALYLYGTKQWGLIHLSNTLSKYHPCINIKIQGYITYLSLGQKA